MRSSRKAYQEMHHLPTGRRRRAFTLIEVLIVISINSLLIVILLSALGAARKNGMEAKCRGNLRSANGRDIAAFIPLLIP